MTVFEHVLIAGLAMTVIALSGALTLLLARKTVERLITPLVAFAAGTLLGGALLHLQPGVLLALPCAGRYYGGSGRNARIPPEGAPGPV